MVIGNDPEEQLAPFNECLDSPEAEHADFFDQTPEFEEEFLKGKVSAWRLPDGKIKLERTKDGNSEYSLPPRKPKGTQAVKVTPSQIYPDLDTFVSEKYDQQRHPLNNKFGYFFNAQAKWDWFQLGGRWTGFFKLKHACPGTKGEAGIFCQPARQGYADQALKKNIDLAGMRKDAEEEAAKLYDRAMLVLEKLPPNLTWSEVYEQYQSEEDGGARARDIYWSQPRCQAWKNQSKDESGSPDPFLLSRTDFVERAGWRSFCTFAVLLDGKWYEQGRMGWFGVSSDNKEETEWLQFIRKTLEQTPPDTQISVYDCHI